ncbi:hypothetical protein [Nitrobacter sp.]|uniref:hypothetical protein n=1 Tax=Nitrobacter sp. TaxID=29420 RepID=UPI0029CAB1EC|nr:hypothetical protein [Nitrobacter sp.]
MSAPTSAEGGPVASTTVQQEFDAFLAKFRAALTANDAAAVAGMTQLPFMPYLDGGGGGSDVAEFRAKSYPRFFTAKTRRCLARTNALYDRGRDGGESFVIFCGNLGFYFQKTQKGFLFTEIGPDD